MDFSLTAEHKSITEPGVAFTLRRIGPKERALMELKLAPQRAELRDIQEQHEELREQLAKLVATGGVTAEGKPLVVEDPTLITPEMLKISNQVELAAHKAENYERANVTPEIIESALLSVTNDGQPVSMEAFQAAASDRLFTEIYQTIINGAYLDPDSAKNLRPSTTLNAAQAGGEATINLAAGRVDQEQTTPIETVSNTSPSA